MTVVIDTNILLVSISSWSKYHWLYKLILDQKVQIAYSLDILNEYEEQISIHWHSDVAHNVIRSLTELSDAVFANIYYNLNLIASDADDNKFVDCAFATNADYIITNDHHFNVLSEVEFPVIPVLNITEFHELLMQNSLL